MRFHFLIVSIMAIAITACGSPATNQAPGKGIENKALPVAAVVKAPTEKKPEVSRATDLRNVAWGDSEQAVIQAEGQPEVQDETNLIYMTKIADKDAALIYKFVDNQLAMAFFDLREKHTNDNAYLDDYADVKDALARKYGPPKEKDIWSGDLYKDEPDHYGMAVATGQLAKAALWETPRTDINVVIHGENFKVIVGIEYASKSLAEKMKSKADTEKQKGL
jgi:hypothetical protein